MKIIAYQPEYKSFFEQLNRAWIEKYFEMEPHDEYLLCHPEENILNKGGKILFAEHNGRIIGTVALVLMEKGIYELAKMAVDEKFQGLGAGKLLCHAAIQEAKNMGAEKLILESNSLLKTAIYIYHKMGFLEIVMDKSDYNRADIRMQLLLPPEEGKWFDRKFDFNLSDKAFPYLLERLETGITRFKEAVRNLPDSGLSFKPHNKWSIKEHLGHISLMEPIWQKRFTDIQNNENIMTSADLSNSATDRADFNRQNSETILEELASKRVQTINLLKNFNRKDFRNQSLHPRLQKPMRIIDLMYFVAEHDDHHLQAMIKIRQQF